MGQRGRLSWLIVTLALLVAPDPARALFHLAVIDEVETSHGGDPDVQFVEIRMQAAAQNLVVNSVLGAFDTAGNYLGDVFVVPANVPNAGVGVRWLMGTAQFQVASGLTPDFVIPANLPTGGGMICWGAPGIVAPAPGSWDHANPLNYVDCLAYGTYTGPSNPLIGTPTPLDADGHSLQRTAETNNNANDFACADAASPTTNAPTSASLAATTPCAPPPTSSTTTTTLPGQIVDPLPPVPQGTVRVDLETVADGLAAPLGLAVPDDGSGRIFVYDQEGRVIVVQDSNVLSAPFLDVSARLVPLGIQGPGSFDERGLIGFALHPDFTANGKVYTYTSEPSSGPADFTVPLPVGETFDHQAVIAEWRVDAGDRNAIDPSTRRELMRIDKPQFNHNGGALRFGPDGFLYIALGDGGSADDEGPGHGTGGNGQNTGNVLGKILRIDVSGNDSANGQYGIPVDNPFVGVSGVDEIYAYGLRNPFSFSFDMATGQLFAGDAGQNDVEEVDVISKGGDFGWRLKEGSFFFDPNGTSDGFVTSVPVGAVPPDLIDPIAEYDHDDGTAIIGGFVYRGAAIPELQGRYVTGDFTSSFVTPSGRLFYIDASGDLAELRIGSPERPLGLFLKGFGQDLAGEVHVLGSQEIGPFGTTGKVLKIMPVADHLLGYKVRLDKTATPPGTPFPKDITRSIRDQLAGQTCGIRKERAIYNPAEKNGEPVRANVHYLSYRIAKCPAFTPVKRTFTDQFFPAGVPISVIKPAALLVPSGKAIQPAADPAALAADRNHYMCYRAKGPKLNLTVMVTDQFTPPTVVTLGKIFQVCLPASTNNEDPGAAADANRYVCYKAKLANRTKHIKTRVRTNNSDFGANSLESKSLLELCVPATQS